MKKRLALVALLAVASSGAIAEWVEVGRTDTSTFYADPATIRRVGNMVKMWHLNDFGAAEVVEKSAPAMSGKVQSEYDCREVRWRTLLLTLHSGNMGRGEIVHSATGSGKWSKILPSTGGQMLWNSACAQR